MTINVALVTNDALILGCDSIASQRLWFIDPTKVTHSDPATGQWVPDANGKFQAAFEFSDMQAIAVNAFGGVQKLFSVYDRKNKTGSPISTVAAITSGMATLNERTMNSLATEFCSTAKTSLDSVDEIVQLFLDFMHEKYEAHYAQFQVPVQFREDIEFLIGGYGKNDQFASLYRLNVKDNLKTLIYGPTHTSHTGVAWGGQAIAVQRIVYGYDDPVLGKFRQVVDGLYDEMSQATARILNETLTALGAQAPAGINATLPAKPTLDNILNEYRLNIDYANIPLQYGVDLVSYLVNLESGKQKFVSGIPTVGGRTHIGVMNKSDGFKELEKPELKHRVKGHIRD